MFLCLAVLRYAYKSQFSTIFSVRFLSHSGLHDTENHHAVLRWLLLLFYSLSCAILLNYLFYDDQFMVYKRLIMLFVIVLMYIFVKRYIVVLVASITKTQELILPIERLRVYHRIVLGVLILLALMLWLLTGLSQYLKESVLVVVIASCYFISVVSLLFTYRKVVLGYWFYFILYLCSLEIAPYLLLYKYFIGGVE